MATASAKEEWRLCADWLVRCQIIAPDHKVTESTSEVFDLAQVLRDGVLICHLLNRLHQGAIDPKDFSQRPQMSQFLCLKNIRVFLTTCRSLFGIKEADLFDPYDLFDVKDFGKVISTLSKLSKTAQAQRSGITGFPPSNMTVRRNSNYYNTLEDKAILYDPYDDGDHIYMDPDEDVGEGIYDDLCSFSKPVEAEPKSKRDYCVKELVETEKNYVEALEMIVVHFIKPMKKVMSPMEVKTVFMCIEDLFDIHKKFQSDLARACHNQGASGFTIPDCFITWKDKLLIYGEFCSNLPKAQDLVDELCKKRPQVRDKVQDCQKQANDGKFRLRDLLSVPMQRVLKYHLLLKELIRQTDRSHPQREGLEKALEEMKDLSLYVNEVKRDNEALQLISEIQDSITDLEMPGTTTLKDYGHLLKDGELKVKSHVDMKNKLRYVFLFDKVMLMCRSRGDTYNYKNALVLSKFKVDEYSRSGRDKWTFQFILAPQDSGSAFTFFAKTEEIRLKWIEAIRMALDNTMPAGAHENGHEFTMWSVDKPTICDVCRKLLRGVFHQGYKCQKTDLVVHKECIGKATHMSGPPRPPQKSRPGPSSSVPSMRERVKAVFDYNGVPPADNGRQIIEIRKGDVLDLLDKSDQQWYKGRLLSGSEGYFPAYCVEAHRTQPRPPSYELAKGCPPAPGSSGLNSRQEAMSRQLPSTSPGPFHTQQRNSSSSPYENLTDMFAEQCLYSPSTYGTPFSCYCSLSYKYDGKTIQPGYLDWQVPARSPEVSPGVDSGAPRSPYYNKFNLDTSLDSKPWFIGEMSREQAAIKLDCMGNGTFLIRESVTPNRRGAYALSIKFGSSVKHIKVQQSGPEDSYYLADCKMFRSIPELVHYYQNNSLNASFPDLQTTLAIPYKDALKGGICTAQYDYAANQPNQLSLKTGDRLEIINKMGDDRGWWKGKNAEGRVGYFPSAYVIESDDF